MQMFGNLHYFIARQIRRLTRDNSGATAVEYAAIAAGIAVAVSGAIVLLGDATGGLYDSIVNLFQ
jgi:pilus assembly protein Flp/PilA